MGSFMRLGCNTRFKRLTLSLICLSALAGSYPLSASANPVLIGIGELIGTILERRAAAYAAEEAADAAFTSRVSAAAIQDTEQAAASKALLVPESSALRTAGKVTWGALNVAAGVSTATDLIGELGDSDLHVSTTGTDLGNGKWQVDVNGTKEVVSFQPSEDNPVFTYGEVQSGSTTTGGGNNQPLTLKGTPFSSEMTSCVPAGDCITSPPSSISATSAIDNNSVLYTFDTDDGTGLYYGLVDNSLARLQDAFIFEAYRSLESNPQLQESTSTASGDNTGGKFTYVTSSYTVDISPSFTPVSGGKYPDVDGSPFSGLDEYLTAKVPYTLHHKKINSSYNPCSVQTIKDSSTGSVVSKNVCIAPTDADYTITDTTDSYDNGMVSLNFNYTGSAPSGTSTALKVVTAADLTTLLASDTLSPDVIADLVTELLSEATTQSGYSGFPFKDSDYITATEVSNALSQLNGKVTAASLFESAEDSDGKIAITTVNESSSTTNNDSSVDLGKDPNTASPDVSDTPTGAEIISPIQDSVSFISGFSLKSIAGTCPVAKFTVFDKDIVIDSQCTLFEENRDFIALISNLVWGILAVLIILGA